MQNIWIFKNGAFENAPFLWNRSKVIRFVYTPFIEKVKNPQVLRCPRQRKRCLPFMEIAGGKWDFLPCGVDAFDGAYWYGLVFETESAKWSTNRFEDAEDAKQSDQESPALHIDFFENVNDPHFPRLLFSLDKDSAGPYTKYSISLLVLIVKRPSGLFR